MAYGKRTPNYNPLTFIKIKFARFLVSSFPLNAVRVLGLRMCGFKVGKKVYIGKGLILTMFNSHSNCDLIIKDRVAIAPRVTLVLASDANWSRINKYITPVEGKIILNEDCWLGTGSIIMPNTSVGNMSMIAAGAVVTKDVPPFTVVAGVPAKAMNKINVEHQ